MRCETREVWIGVVVVSLAAWGVVVWASYCWTGWEGRQVHKSVTLDRVVALVEGAAMSLDNPGICVRCGEDAEGCEPDMRRGECESCGARAVYGAEELLLMLA